MDVLVAEDDADIRESICGLLGDEGFSVHAVETGGEALDVLRNRQDFCLVLLDARTPGKSGYEALDELRTWGMPERRRIVVMTAGNANDPRFNGFEVIKKPFDVEKFLEVVERSCGQYRRH